MPTHHTGMRVGDLVVVLASGTPGETADYWSERLAVDPSTQAMLSQRVDLIDVTAMISDDRPLPFRDGQPDTPWTRAMWEAYDYDADFHALVRMISRRAEAIERARAPR